MSTSRRAAVAALVGALGLALAACGSGAASSEDYPSGDVTMVVSYAAGGPTDLAGRAIAKALESDLGTSVVVENVDGASGAVGTQEVVSARPDGLTIGMTTASAVSRVPLIEKLGYSVDDVAPVAVIKSLPGVVLVRDDSPFTSMEELVDAARSDPGGITVGTAGLQSPQAVEVARMRSEYDVDLKLVPFAGDAPSVTALLGGQVDAIVPGYGDVIDGYAEAGDVRTLAVMSPEPSPDLPGVPTLAELGFDELTFGVTDYILVAPKDTPREIVDRLESATREAMQDPATVEELRPLGIPEEFVGAEALRTKMNDEVETLAPVLKSLFG